MKQPTSKTPDPVQAQPAAPQLADAVQAQPALPQPAGPVQVQPAPQQQQADPVHQAFIQVLTERQQQHDQQLINVLIERNVLRAQLTAAIGRAEAAEGRIAALANP